MEPLTINCLLIAAAAIGTYIGGAFGFYYATDKLMKEYDRHDG